MAIWTVGGLTSQKTLGPREQTNVKVDAIKHLIADIIKKNFTQLSTNAQDMTAVQTRLVMKVHRLPAGHWTTWIESAHPKREGIGP